MDRRLDSNRCPAGVEHNSNPLYIFPKISNRPGQFGSATVSYKVSPGFDGPILSMVTEYFRG